MKLLKPFLLFSLAIFAITSLQAQISLGVKGGVNMSTTYGSPEEMNGEKIEGVALRPGFQLGLVLGAGLTDGFKIRGEVNFENRNGLKTVDLVTNVPTPAGDVVVTTAAELKNSFNYINIPVLAVLGSGNIKLYAGPNFAYLLSAKTTQTTMTDVVLPPGLPEDTPGLPQSGSTTVERDFKNDAPYDEDGSFINEFDLGANVGVMVLLSEKLRLDLRLNHGLSDATNNDYDTSILDGSKREDSDKNVSIQLGIGVSF